MILMYQSLNHQDIYLGYFINPCGNIKHANMSDDEKPILPDYHSTNGYDFVLLLNKDGKPQLFPIDDLLALTFIPIPKSLQSKRVKVNHINGNTRDNDLGNLEWVEDIEEWKTCTYPGVKPDMYEVSSWGRVRNKNTGIYRGNFQIYIRCRLKTTKGNPTYYLLHRLVAFEFCKVFRDFDKSEVNHIDGIKYHNWYKNLEWVSPSENTRHANMTQLHRTMIGEECWNSKLTVSDVEKICEIIIKCQGNVSDIFKSVKSLGINVSYQDIIQIKAKRNWKHISDLYFKLEDYTVFKKKRLSVENVEKICLCLIENDGNVEKTFKDITKQNIVVTYQDISNIKHKYSWRRISDKFFIKDQFK